MSVGPTVLNTIYTTSTNMTKVFKSNVPVCMNIEKEPIHQAHLTSYKLLPLDDKINHLLTINQGFDKSNKCRANIPKYN